MTFGRRRPPASQNGQPIGIQAMVFRQVGIPDAVFCPTNAISALRAEYLGEMGVQFAGDQG